MLEIEIKNVDKIAALLATAVDQAVAKIINKPEATGVLEGADSWAARGAKLAAIRSLLADKLFRDNDPREMLTAIEKIISGDPTAHKHIKPSFSVLPSYDEIMRRGGAGVEERPNRPTCSRNFVESTPSGIRMLHSCSGDHGPVHPFTTQHHTCKHCGVRSAIKTTDDVLGMWHGPICERPRGRYGND